LLIPETRMKEGGKDRGLSSTDRNEIVEPRRQVRRPKRPPPAEIRLCVSGVGPRRVNFAMHPPTFYSWVSPSQIAHNGVRISLKGMAFGPSISAALQPAEKLDSLKGTAFRPYIIAV